VTRDEVSAIALVVSFAALVTAHVSLVAGLAARRPRWRALVALVVAPLAPYWGLREYMRARSIAWIAFAFMYAAARVVASR
jgi:hypothetical protein